MVNHNNEQQQKSKQRNRTGAGAEAVTPVTIYPLGFSNLVIRHYRSPIISEPIKYMQPRHTCYRRHPKQPLTPHSRVIASHIASS